MKKEGVTPVPDAVGALKKEDVKLIGDVFNKFENDAYQDAVSYLKSASLPKLTPEQYAQTMNKVTGTEPVRFTSPQVPPVPGSSKADQQIERG